MQNILSAVQFFFCVNRAWYYRDGVINSVADKGYTYDNSSAKYMYVHCTNIPLVTANSRKYCETKAAPQLTLATSYFVRTYEVDQSVKWLRLSGLWFKDRSPPKNESMIIVLGSCQIQSSSVIVVYINIYMKLWGVVLAFVNYVFVVWCETWSDIL